MHVAQSATCRLLQTLDDESMFKKSRQQHISRADVEMPSLQPLVDQEVELIESATSDE